MDDEWRATPTFLNLYERGLADLEEGVDGAGDVRTGPGSHGHYFWKTRITEAGILFLKRTR